MDIFRKLGQKALVIGLVLVVLLTAGCAGIKPYEPRDYREEGMEKGLFTGSEGEFVIYKKAGEPQTGSEAGKRSDETADGEQQEMGNEEKKEETKSGVQQPEGIDVWGRIQRTDDGEQRTEGRRKEV
jgi:hypothetical protein